METPPSTRSMAVSGWRTTEQAITGMPSSRAMALPLADFQPSSKPTGSQAQFMVS